MRLDNAPLARRAGLTLLRADSALTALVGDRVYPEQRPAKVVWPFLAWGVMIETPFEAACMTGSQIDFAIHAYAETTGTGGSTVAGEKRAREIANLAVSILVDAGEIDLADHDADYPAKLHFTWAQTQAIQDRTEADAWHAFATMRAHVVS